ncbi:MAG: transglutaminase-like domain-containing protein [Lachnospiraceae bacterium]|nr:transglutaminase-like domain-containing protein [Lachnospiraceae bacterium]
MKRRIISVISVISICLCMLSGASSPREIDAQYGAYTKQDVVQSGDIYLYHFGNSAKCGLAPDGTSIDFEGFAGFKATTNGSKVTYTMYTHTSSYNAGAMRIASYHDCENYIDLGVAVPDKSQNFDMADACKSIKDVSNAYVLSIYLEGEDKPHVDMNLYYDGKNVKTCRKGMIDTERRIAEWNDLVGNLKPKTCLNMYVGTKEYPITYPTSGTDGHCNHVQEWCDLSDEIVLHDDWTDEVKVFAFTLWLTRNTAYDNYRVDKNDNKSRATLENDWDNDDLWMYYNHVGQCWDYGNAMAIMCRHHGIPCTTVENNHHEVTCVWLNNEWVAIDVSVLVKYHCYDKDTDPKNWTVWRDSSFSDAYGYYDDTMVTYNQGLTTPHTALQGMDGKNPM